MTIVPRNRNSPVDRVVSELMIHANCNWASCSATAICAPCSGCRTAAARLSLYPAPHGDSGVSQYLWRAHRCAVTATL